jgi:hypothetical protein
MSKISTEPHHEHGRVPWQSSGSEQLSTFAMTSASSFSTSGCCWANTWTRGCIHQSNTKHSNHKAMSITQKRKGRCSTTAQMLPPYSCTDLTHTHLRHTLPLVTAQLASLMPSIQNKAARSWSLQHHHTIHLLCVRQLCPASTCRYPILQLGSSPFCKAALPSHTAPHILAAAAWMCC